ncbi:TonB-dependent receptor family protein [Pelagerythrobacter marensis]|uniref:Putative TonB-dependent receptor n=1 Tax=Pelagerythrobacter marensis TaxID=543877 RepID=A0A0G3X8R1_9SPHN|nr:TonB-dependent receptor [Pelagerythrobacter marensis]AKM07950.1 Putative TonB-dependent receptor [Pelagerythrobacter marensis]
MTISRIALAAALAAVALPAHAETAAETARDGGRTIIVTGARAADEAEERAAATPGGTDVVTHEDYADKSPVSLRDALAFSPGVYLQPRYGQEVRISIRGSGLSRGYHMRGITLLQDGVPINLADDNGDFQELDPIFFDHLEVYRGANALRFGSGTLGGAINGVTPTGRTASGIYLRADAGSFDTVRGLASAGVAAGPGDAWGAVAFDRSDGDRDHAARRSFRFHGNAGIALSDRVETRFYASANTINQDLPGALDLETVRAAPKTGNFAGDMARDIDSLRLQNRTSFRFDRGQIDAGVFVNAKALYHPIFQVVDQESLDRGVYARFNYADGPFELTMGGEARFGDTRSKRFVNIEGERGDLTFDADQDAHSASLYGEVRFRPVAPLQLIAGGIYADGHREQHLRYNSFMGGAVDVTGRADYHAFSPRFGVLFEPAAGIQVFANYSRSVEFPGFIELAQIAGFVDLDPQRAWTLEAGTRGRSGIAEWDIAAYRADLKGELLQFDVGPDIPAATFNAGETRHQGIEAALSLDLASWARLRQIYQYSDFRFIADAQYGDNRLPVVPEHLYRAELRLGTDALHLAPSVEWVPRGAWADYANSLRVASYALVGLTAGATVTEGIDLFLDARNLLGETAVGDISAAITATPESAIFYPVERRAVFGGVRARF